jgi:hypothetical protein
MFQEPAAVRPAPTFTVSMGLPPGKARLRRRMVVVSELGFYRGVSSNE